MLAHASPARLRLALLLGFLAVCALALALPHGRMAPMGEMRHDDATGAASFVHDDARMARHGAANAAGSVAVLLTLAGLGLPYLRRGALLRLHRALGVAVLALAAAHMLLYLADGSLRGWLPGLASFAAFAAHGLTGALKARLLRAWGPARWRVLHRGSAWAALGLVAMHILLASWHYGLARYFEGA